MPVVAALNLIVLIVYLHLRVNTDTMIGRLEVSSSGDLKLKDRSDKCKSIFILYKPMMIQITTVKGYNVNVWRDACLEHEYRQLLVILNSFVMRKKE